MSRDTALTAVELGLLRFALPHESFPGRDGQPRDYLVDSRGAGTNLPLREFIVKQLAFQLKAIPNIETVVGVAKSGISWGAWLAWDVGLPFAAVNPDGPRGSGLQRAVEGDIDGRRALLIDNWVRSGASIRKATNWIKDEGGTVCGVLTIARPERVMNVPDLSSLWILEELLSAHRELQEQKNFKEEDNK